MQVAWENALQRAVGYVLPWYLGLCEMIVLRWLPDLPAVGVNSPPSVAAAAAALVTPFLLAPIRPRTPRLLPVAELLQALRLPMFIGLVVMFAVTMILMPPVHPSGLSASSGASGFFNLSAAGTLALVVYGLAVAYVEARNQVV